MAAPGRSTIAVIGDSIPRSAPLCEAGLIIGSPGGDGVIETAPVGRAGVTGLEYWINGFKPDHLRRRPNRIPTRVRSSPAQLLPACSPARASPSAWTAKGPGEIMCSSNGCGAASNTRRSICEPTKPSARRDIRSAGISTSTTAHQNTHLSMLLKRRDFADWDAIPWGILGSVALVRR